MLHCRALRDCHRHARSNRSAIKGDASDKESVQLRGQARCHHRGELRYGRGDGPPGARAWAPRSSPSISSRRAMTLPATSRSTCAIAAAIEQAVAEVTTIARAQPVLLRRLARAQVFGGGRGDGEFHQPAPHDQPAGAAHAARRCHRQRVVRCRHGLLLFRQAPAAVHGHHGFCPGPGLGARA